MLFGFDYLGLAKFSAGARDSLPNGYALGVFSNTFGDAMPQVKKLVGKFSALRVQLFWSDNDHNYDVSEAAITNLKTEAKKWGKFAKEHNVTLYLSPFCEHKLSNPDPYLKIVKEQAPNCVPVNSVWTGKLTSNPEYMNEVHGSKATVPNIASSNKPGNQNKPVGYIFSYDGSDMVESDVEIIKTRHSTAAIWFGWTSNFNGVLNAKDKTSRSSRTAWPSEKLISSLRYIMSNTKGAAGLQPNWAWVSHFQDGKGTDAKYNKPALIGPVKANTAELLKSGKAVASAPYGGMDTSGRHKYHFSSWGYEIAQKNGNSLLEVKVGGKSYGTVNPAFREREYR